MERPDMHRAAALRCCTQLSKNQSLEFRFCLRQLAGYKSSF
jgi:hypothetical protein